MTNPSLVYPVLIKCHGEQLGWNASSLPEPPSKATVVLLSAMKDDSSRRHLIIGLVIGLPRCIDSIFKESWKSPGVESSPDLYIVYVS